MQGKPWDLWFIYIVDFSDSSDTGTNEKALS